jgi:hypothetical protein
VYRETLGAQDSLAGATTDDLVVAGLEGRAKRRAGTAVTAAAVQLMRNSGAAGIAAPPSPVTDPVRALLGGKKKQVPVALLGAGRRALSRLGGAITLVNHGVPPPPLPLPGGKGGPWTAARLPPDQPTTTAGLGGMCVDRALDGDVQAQSGSPLASETESEGGSGSGSDGDVEGEEEDGGEEEVASDDGAEEGSINEGQGQDGEVYEDSDEGEAGG